MDNRSTAEQEVLALGRQWAAADLRGDAAALGALLTEDFVCVGPLGFVIDKEQYLAGRRSGDLRYTSLLWADVHVRLYRDTAVAVGTQTQQGTYQGRDASGRFRVTQIAVRQGGRWAIAGLHYCAITQPPGPPGAAS